MQLKLLIGILLGGLILYFSCILVFYLFQDGIVFQPKNLKESHTFQFDQSFEEVWLKTSDSIDINGLYFSSPESRGVVLYLHGNKGNLQRWAKYNSDFTERGFDFFAIDYRGYGKSLGQPSEKGLYTDALAAYEWLKQKYPEEKITIYGRSLGSGVASQLATTVSPKRLILETPFNSIKGAIDKSMPALWLPVATRSLFPNEHYLPQIEEPIHIIQGTKDRIVPYASAAALKPLLKERDDFFVIEGGGHRNLNSFPEYYQYLDRIFEGQ